MFSWVSTLDTEPVPKKISHEHLDEGEQRDSSKLCAGFVNGNQGLTIYHPAKNNNGVLLSTLISQDKHLNKCICMLNQLQSPLGQKGLNSLHEVFQNNSISDIRLRNVELSHIEWKKFFGLVQEHAKLTHVLLDFYGCFLEHRSTSSIAKVLGSFGSLQTLRYVNFPNFKSMRKKNSLLGRLKVVENNFENTASHGIFFFKRFGASKLEHLREIDLGCATQDERSAAAFYLHLRSTSFVKRLEKFHVSRCPGEFHAIVELVKLVQVMSNLKNLLLPRIRPLNSKVGSYCLHKTAIHCDNHNINVRIGFYSVMNNFPQGLLRRMYRVKSSSTNWDKSSFMNVEILERYCS
eukprot:snap_masked-scaffold_42-processed-gene-1.17-mRNA-1 protein AED:1.00 eAED:1.00 QI:0/-1/0/0/-1/1/1/0/348